MREESDATTSVLLTITILVVYLVPAYPYWKKPSSICYVGCCWDYWCVGTRWLPVPEKTALTHWEKLRTALTHWRYKKHVLLWKIIHFLFLKLQNVSCAYTGWSHTVSSQPIGRRSFVNLGQKWRSKKKWKARIIPSLEFSSYIVYNDEYKFLAFYVLSITLSIIIQ